MPRSNIGYDVMIAVGVKRFVEHFQREEIRAFLQEKHGISLSTGEVSVLAARFLTYLEALHQTRAPQLRAALAADGGWPLHIDATGEDGRGTLFVALAGWRKWVLGSWKIPTERDDAIRPHLDWVAQHFGTPCAIVRDLGRAMTKAATGFCTAHGVTIPVLACHLHFLRDVGNDLLEPGHNQLRVLFRRFAIRPRLCALARDLGRRLGNQLAAGREAVRIWQQQNPDDEGHVLPVGQDGLATIRAMAQWILDFTADGFGEGFPFDRPYSNLFARCLTIRRAVDAFTRRPAPDQAVRVVLERLGRIVDPVRSDPAFVYTANKLKTRADLFEEVRLALRLRPKQLPQIPSFPVCASLADIEELVDTQKALEQLAVDLRNRRLERSPARDQREAIDLIVRHLEVHGPFLWGHVIPVPEAAGGGFRIVDRTNNTEEGFFKKLKHGERRRSGRKSLTQDFERMPAAAALAANLTLPDYVTILCGSIDRLPAAFAQIDEQRKAIRHACASSPRPTGLPALPTHIISAALPATDKSIIRTEALKKRIYDAARSCPPRRRHMIHPPPTTPEKSNLPLTP